MATRGVGSWARRFALLWHADLADPVQIATLRRNIFVVAWLLAVSATLGTALTDTAASPELRLIQYSSLVVEAVMGVATLGWGVTMGDLGFSLLLYAGLVMAATGVAAHADAGVVARIGMIMTTNVVMGAIFLTRRRWIAAQLVVVLGLLTAIAVRSHETSEAVLDLSTTASGVVTISVAVRVLRDLAFTAVRSARRGEVTDPLTGLLNRRGMERRAQEYWHDRARGGTPVLALVVDVDHFKTINDSQGHAAGDEVLRRLGALLSASLRGRDLAVRLGGEEFLVLCEAPAGQGEAIAERLRRSVEEQLAPVTVSIGVHEVNPGHADVVPEAVWTAVEVADQALYEAKRAGRNRVVQA